MLAMMILSMAVDSSAVGPNGHEGNPRIMPTMARLIRFLGGAYPRLHHLQPARDPSTVRGNAPMLIADGSFVPGDDVEYPTLSSFLTIAYVRKEDRISM
jgi:hypothetical protein